MNGGHPDPAKQSIPSYNGFHASGTEEDVMPIKVWWSYFDCHTFMVASYLLHDTCGTGDCRMFATEK